MSNHQPTAPGFSIPTSGGPPYGGYAPVQQQPGYPGQGNPYPIGQGYPGAGGHPQQPQAGYPSYPQSHQPFPAPMQQAPGYAQPQPIQWMTGNFQSYLAGATAFEVKQKKELLEILTGWETGNKYSVKDQAGNQVFYVGEQTSLFPRICCGAMRPFHLTTKDTRGQTVLEFSRDLDLGAMCCGCCCSDEVKVTAPGGQFLGSIGENCGIIYSSYNIKNASGQKVLGIEGPACMLSCGGPVNFRVVDQNGVQVGVISKKWGGIIREMFTDADTFSITFPVHVDPAIKAVLLGALFMIDFHHFEKGGDGGQGRRLFG